MMRSRALTLVEVVASLVLMASVVSALLVAQGKLLRHLRFSEDQKLAAVLAEELIASWALESPIAPEGIFEDHPGWSWARRTSTTPLVSDPLVEEITLDIVQKWPSGEERRLASYQWLERRYVPPPKPQ